MTWRIHPLEAGVRVVATRPMPGLSPALEAAVAAEWRAARAASPALFNGCVFSLDRIAPTRIEGHWTEYRRVLAQIRRPALFGDLGLRSLAVNGVVVCRDGVLFGRRRADAVYQPGMWQLPPAGSVDDGARQGEAADLSEQVLRELAEETGIGRAAVDGLRPLCAVEHPGSHVVDLGIGLSVALDRAAVLGAAARAPHREYAEMRVVATAAVPEAVAAMGAGLVPPARVFLRRMKLLPQVTGRIEDEIAVDLEGLNRR